MEQKKGIWIPSSSKRDLLISKSQKKTGNNSAFKVEYKTLEEIKDLQFIDRTEAMQASIIRNIPAAPTAKNCLKPAFHRWASLARIIIISSTDNCNAVFVYDNKLYYAAKLSVINKTKWSDNKIKREGVLQIIKKVLVSTNNEEKELAKLELWKLVKKATTKVVNNRRARATTFEFYKRTSPYKKIWEAYSKWEALFENSSQQSNKEAKSELPDLEKMSASSNSFIAAILQVIKNGKQIDQAWIDAPSYLELVLFVRDYMQLIEDLDLYDDSTKSEESLLGSAWKLIREERWEDVSTELHSEKAIISACTKRDGIGGFIKACKAGQASNEENPLVASLWQCYVCWNTIDIGGRHGNQDDRNVDVNCGIIYPHSLPLHFDFKEQEEGRERLELVAKELDQTVDKVCEDSVKWVETSAWIEKQDMIYYERIS